MRCELRLGSVVLPAMLLDESSGGFGVLVGGLPSISANQTAQLRNDRGWFDCRIVYAREVVPTKAVPVMGVVPTKHITADGAMEYITTADIKEFTAGMEGPWFQLGIRCLGRIAPPSEPATSLPVESGGVNPMQWIKSMLTCVFDR
jgi:hypothetical protein